MMWNAGWVVKYVLGLMPGLEDMSLLGSNYNELERTVFVHIHTPKYGRVIYSPEHNKFWLCAPVRTTDLPAMPFGLSTEGLVVKGSEAVVTTIEAGLIPCAKAHYGARKFLKEFLKK